ncbi:MAG: hypothetical protein HY290_26630 [Planctomycetia bacterium]|nr:hypothetical protein [Planctomycetia bacterium]
MTTRTLLAPHRATFFLLWAWAACGATCALAAEPENEAAGNRSVDEDSVIDSFPIDGNGNLLLIPVTIAETQHFFILDTGANVSAFGPGLKNYLTPSGQKRVINGGATYDVYDCPTVSAGRSEWRAKHGVISADLSNLQPCASHPISGILGMDFLSDKVLQIDFDARRLSFSKRETQVAGQRIPLHIGTDDLPQVDIDLPNGSTERFIVDTGYIGFSSGHLCERTFGRLSDRGHLNPFSGQTESAIFGGTRHSREGVLAWISLAGARHEMQFFDEHNSHDSSNAIGLGYLARFKLTFDFENRVLILDEGKRFNWVCPVNWAGIDIAMADGVSRVLEVEKQRPAWNAGLRPGDVFVSLNGHDATHMRLDEIGSTLQCVILKPSTTNVHFTWGGAPLFKLKVPGRAVSVKVVRPPSDEPHEFTLFRPDPRPASTRP